MARLADIEKEIKDLIEEGNGDLSNPEIFNKIYDLIRFWFLRTKKITNYNILDGVAMEGAEMLYIKLLKGGHIDSWLSYISLAYQSFIREYKKMNGTEFIDATNDPLLVEAIANMSCSTVYEPEFEESENLQLIDLIPEVIDEVVDNSRYEPYSREYYTARMILSLSMVASKYISIYMETDEEREYNRLLYELVKRKITEKVCSNITKSASSSLSPFQLLAIDSCGVESYD